MTRMIRIALLSVCTAALTAAAARADINPRWSDDQLAGFAAAIVSGRVTGIGTGRDIATGAVHGAGAHPGGGVTGLPGRNAALGIIRDFRRGAGAASHDISLFGGEHPILNSRAKLGL